MRDTIPSATTLEVADRRSDMNEMELAFPYEHEGKSLMCTRRVSGARVLKQVITVPGFGSRSDRHSYGGRHYPVSIMETNARQVAFEVIRDASRLRRRD